MLRNYDNLITALEEDNKESDDTPAMYVSSRQIVFFGREPEAMALIGSALFACFGHIDGIKEYYDVLIDKIISQSKSQVMRSN